MRQSAKIHTVELDYWQTAVVATLTLAEVTLNYKTCLTKRYLLSNVLALYYSVRIKRNELDNNITRVR